MFVAEVCFLHEESKKEVLGLARATDSDTLIVWRGKS